MLIITPRVALFSVPAVLLHLVSEIVVVCFLWSLRGQFKAVIEEAELLDDNLGPMEGWVIIPEVRLMRCLLGRGVRFVIFLMGTALIGSLNIALTERTRTKTEAR